MVGYCHAELGFTSSMLQWGIEMLLTGLVTLFPTTLLVQRNSKDSFGEENAFCACSGIPSLLISYPCVVEMNLQLMVDGY